MSTAEQDVQAPPEGGAHGRRRRLEPADRRRQILSCAVRLFGEHGYDGVSSADVAREAGVARGLVNHYFGTKKDLYLEVVRVLATVPEGALGEVPAGNLAQRVDEAVNWFLDAVSRHASVWIVTVAGAGPGRGTEVAEVVAAADEETVDQLLRLAGVTHLKGIHPGAAAPDGDPAANRRTTPEQMRAMLRSYVHFARGGAVEWLVRGSLTREQTHRLLSRTLIALLDGTLDVADTR